MKKFALIAAACGILGGIGMIVGAILDEKFPKPLWAVVAVLTLTGAIANICAYRRANRQ